MNDQVVAGALDRVDEAREQPEWVSAQWAADARMVQSDARGNLLLDDGALRQTPVSGEYDPERHFLLGMLEGTPVFVEETEPSPDSSPLLRIGHQLSDADREIATVATGVLAWHRTERFCGICGTPTVATRGGFSRFCPTCVADHFPRQDPAVIVAVVDDDDRILLGHHVNWDEYRMSLLAGFVSIGESFEQTVHRELAEEADLRLDAVRYVGSQPWPFPRSLMVGFTAHAIDTHVRVDGREIMYAEWFTREEMTARVAEETLKLPGGWSIAHRIITAWHEGRLPDPRS